MVCYYLHQLTFPEVLTALADKDKSAVTDLQGRSLYGKTDRQLWPMWTREVGEILLGISAKHHVTPKVVKFYEATKHFTSPPKGDPATLFKPPRFSWSLTSLQDFENCPLCFAEKRFYKRFKDKPFDAQDFGNRLHKAAEDYTRDSFAGTPKTYEPDLIQVVKPYSDAIVATARRLDAILHVEHELNFTEDFKPCAATDWDRCWYRGKSDITMIVPAMKKCFVWDWKTGKRKDDPTQVQLMCACEAILNPEIEEFEGRYVWLREKKNPVSDPVILKRADLVGVWKNILARVHRMRQAWDSQVFQARTSGLCRQYCPVTTCPHCGKK